MSVCLPYLVASANWVLGELAPCLPEVRFFSFLCHLFYLFLSHRRSAYHLLYHTILLPLAFLYTWATELLIFNEKHHHTSLPEFQSCFQEMSADVYSSLLKALAMPDKEDTSCYPVRVSAAGAIATLLEVGLWRNRFGFCYGSRYNVILGFHLAFILVLFRVTMRHPSGYLFLKLWLAGLVIEMKKAPFYISFSVP